VEVLRRQERYSGSFPLSYTTLADDDRLETLTIITEMARKRTAFKLASSQEIAKEDREFICKLFNEARPKRPSAKVLLQDVWLREGTAAPTSDVLRHKGSTATCSSCTSHQSWDGIADSTDGMPTSHPCLLVLADLSILIRPDPCLSSCR
jgi:hypothetical protein